MAADNGAIVFSVKDDSFGSLNLNYQDVSVDAIKSSNALAKAVTQEMRILGTQGINLGKHTVNEAFDFASDVLGYAADTQAQFAETVRAEWTSDLTEVVNNALNAVMIVAGIYFIVQVMK
ncbi:MAG: hypothetical protein KF769_05445 [Parvibaculum sp.]|nr:hypothetical protein [Parvibaculum sp.]